jgi:uncharacterized membrane protein YqjE
MPDSKENKGGLLDSFHRVANSVFGLFHNRLALIAVELQEEKLRAINLIIGLCVAMALGIAGVLVAVGALAFFLWERAGYAGLVGLAVVALAGAAVTLILLRRQILYGPQPFSVSVTEIGKDIDSLRSRR